MDCGRFPAFVDQPSFAGHAFGEGTGVRREMLGRMFAQASLKDRDLAQVTLALAPSHKEGIAMIFAQMADSDKGWSAFDHFEISHLAPLLKNAPTEGQLPNSAEPFWVPTVAERQGERLPCRTLRNCFPMRWGQGRVAFRKGLPRPRSTPLWEAAEATLVGGHVQCR